MKDFTSFLVEDGAVAANVTGGMASPDNVFGGVPPALVKKNKKKLIDGSNPNAAVVKESVAHHIPLHAVKKPEDVKKLSWDDLETLSRDSSHPLHGYAVGEIGYRTETHFTGGELHEDITDWLARLTQRTFEIPNYEHSLRMNRATHLNLADYTKMAKELHDAGITVGAINPDPRSLKPTQRNFDWKKVNQMLHNNSYLHPVITSQDGYIIDGHHRWLAACINKDPVIAAREIKLGITDALDWLKDKDYPRNNDLQEGQKYIPGAGMVGGASDEYPDEYEMRPNGEWMPKSPSSAKSYTSSNGPKIQHFHQVDYKDKDQAKTEGMKWDPKEKGWFHEHTHKSKDSKFKYVKSVRYDKIDPSGEKVNRTEWVRPSVEGEGRDAFTFQTTEVDSGPVVKDEPSKDELSLQYVHHVSYMDKEAAKADGMLWDPKAKHWYYTDPEKSNNSKFPYHKTVAQRS